MTEVKIKVSVRGILFDYNDIVKSVGIKNYKIISADSNSHERVYDGMWTTCTIKLEVHE